MHFVTLCNTSEKDRYCCLLFDEMSIRENVWFNQKFDCIEGYEDLGSQGRTRNMANHALLFLLRGLCRNWKQLVAYYLSHGSTKAEMLKQFLKEVLEACQNVGLHVVATVCDGYQQRQGHETVGFTRGGSHTSSFRIKQLLQYMTLHTS